jgi:hypothetical protein
MDLLDYGLLLLFYLSWRRVLVNKEERVEVVGRVKQFWHKEIE